MNKLLLGVLLAVSTVAVAEDKNEKKNTEKTPVMIAVKGGKFDMGSDDEAMDRRPAHRVSLKDFSIGKYEVTEAQYRAIMGNDAVTFPHCDQCPVTNVSWNDVQTYIQKLNEATGHQYRLPTEAEWEFAAQGGRERNRENAKKYSGKRVLQYIAWFDRNAKEHVHEVGRKDPNELGIHDMTGNVEEWCNDWYSKDYFSKKDVTNPQGPEGGTAKVVRGGSWKSNKDELSVTRRAAYQPKEKSIALGFRLAE